MSIILTVSDVSKMLQMSKSAVYKYAEAGKIPSIKIGSCLRFTESQINDFLSVNTKTAKPSEEKAKV